MRLSGELLNKLTIHMMNIETCPQCFEIKILIKGIWMLNKDKDGWINSLKVHKEHKSAIEKSPIGTVKSIVLHRTGSSNAQSVLNAWENKPEGTHFLISETGKISKLLV